ncbi:MAG TPA: class I SAM-dependent methyltransferase [Pyrinomonadaceae bacterium]|nr:class I SAM-dependent methyltransferase [Pyrinomonadaceae bacterium]
MKPISQTAFYCCGVRMQDAERERPVCGDVYAKVFMNEDGLRIFEKFKDETGPNSSNVARHRIIDDLLRQELAAHPDLRVVIVGAGFDSRACRLKGGTWIEFDEPQVIAYKNERLPVSDAQNELHRVAIDFSTERLEDKLSPFAGRGGPVVVVVEGVFMYLEQQAIEQLLQTLRRLFPRHKLICDLMTRKFFEKYGRTIHEKLTGMGATFKFTADNPEEIFVKNGYQRVDQISTVVKSTEFEGRKIPKILFKTLLRTLASGYAIYVFETR